MRSHRSTILIVATMASSLMAVAPLTAAANTLLSGYGGPGQGDQAILGATLLNGPGAGGGGGSGSSESPPTSLAAPAAQPATHAHARHRPAGLDSKKRQREPSKTTARAYTAPAGAGAARPVTASSGGLLGLSLADLVYILLALGGLAVTAALMRGLMSAPRQDGEALKG